MCSVVIQVVTVCVGRGGSVSNERERYTHTPVISQYNITTTTKTIQSVHTLHYILHSLFTVCRHVWVGKIHVHLRMYMLCMFHAMMFLIHKRTMH